MKYGPDDKLWVVLDPTSESTKGDILFQASLRELALHFKGGLTMDRNPAIFTDEKEAEIEAYGRLTAMRASQAIAGSTMGSKLQDATRFELLDADGNVLFEADLPYPRS
ncbi:hypothetical protein ACFL6M_04345 [Candidatus Eisenbacteria bacterium]|uniref:DUF306 domain-containing protein n=1 Tax=Eiseniibacteriota bacterium TaxID=2212470 RepID=A0ABV6YKF2_UNCEI